MPFAAVLMAFVAATAAGPSISGSWTFDYDHPDGAMHVTLVLVESNGEVTGTFGAAGKLKGALQGDKLTAFYDNKGVGRLELIFDVPRKSFKGTWGVGAEPPHFRASGVRLAR